MAAIEASCCSPCSTSTSGLIEVRIPTFVWSGPHAVRGRGALFLGQDHEHTRNRREIGEGSLDEVQGKRERHRNRRALDGDGPQVMDFQESLEGAEGEHAEMTSPTIHDGPQLPDVVPEADVHVVRLIPK